MRELDAVVTKKSRPRLRLVSARRTFLTTARSSECGLTIFVSSRESLSTIFQTSQERSFSLFSRGSRVQPPSRTSTVGQPRKVFSVEKRLKQSFQGYRIINVQIYGSLRILNLWIHGSVRILNRQIYGSFLDPFQVQKEISFYDHKINPNLYMKTYFTNNKRGLLGL